jgi:hypothetical protein
MYIRIHISEIDLPYRPRLPMPTGDRRSRTPSRDFKFTGRIFCTERLTFSRLLTAA